MPLLPGKENVGKNIEELKKSGWDNPRQRLAIVMSKLNEKAKKGEYYDKDDGENKDK